MFGDGNGFRLRAAGKPISNAASKLASVERVNLGISRRTPLTSARSSIGVGKTILDLVFS